MKNKKYFLIIIPIILSRLIIIIIASFFIIKNKTPWLASNPSGENSFLNIFAFHDAQYYIGIAKQGYCFVAEQNTPIFHSTNLSYAFFPLYPLLIRLTHFFTGISYSLSGILTSLFCFISSTLILYKLLPEGTKEYGIWLWCFNPISIYFFSIYTESLFVFLTLLSWYFYNKNKYFLCGIFIGLCILTRNTGAVWGIIVFADAIYKKIILKKQFLKKDLKDIINLSFPIFCLGSIYPIYLKIVKNDFLYFITIQKDWLRIKGYLVDTIFIDFMRIFNPVYKNYASLIILNLFCLTLVCIFSIYSLKKYKVLSVFLLLGCIYPLFSICTMVPATKSLMRYIFGLFPIYILLPSIKSKRIKIAILFIFILYSIIITEINFGGGFIA